MPTLAGLDLLGDPLRPPTRRERHRVATQRRPRPAAVATSLPTSLPTSPSISVEPPTLASSPATPQATPLAAPSARPSRLAPALLALHPQLWRSDELGDAAAPCLPSGHALLDAELPGGGWPTRAVTELLLSGGHGVEWRLLAPGLVPLTRGGRRLLLIGPPHQPHPRGLADWGLPASACLWVAVDPTTQRLWALEQALRADADEVAALLAWLPGLRAAQLRRLQSLAARCRAPVFVLHADPLAQASAAVLRLRVAPGPHWAQLQVEILKRRGPPLATPLWLQAAPPSLAAVLPLSTTATALPAALRALLAHAP